jgi:hypothetical protein
VDDRRIEQAAEKLRNGRRRTIECAVLALATLAGAISAAPFTTRFAVIFGACAATEVLLALAALLSRRDLIGRLALEPAAYVLPEVRRYGEQSAQLKQRERLAAWLAELPALSQLPGTIYLADRIEAVAAELEWLGHELAAPSARVDAASAVACRRLLTDAVGSALYNPRVPEDDLHLALRRIRFGISRT